ncbi:MAG: hypothetical protein WC314_06475 [Vulcanimicrobiota bacterium]
MNSQRVFWITGAATILVLVLISGALVARSEAPKTAPFTVATSPSSENEVLRNELAQAYADLDRAYRDIERLQQTPGSQKKHHGKDHDEDDDD